jgi:hypothetical protein
MTGRDMAVAERVRGAVLEAAMAAFEDAAMRGLCCDGAWEAAVSAMRQLDVAELLRTEPRPATDTRG